MVLSEITTQRHSAGLFLTVKMNTVHHCCFFFACREPDLRCSSVVDCSTLRDISRAQRADWGEVFWKSKARWPGEGNQGSLACRLSNGGKLALTSEQAYKTRLQDIFFFFFTSWKVTIKEYLKTCFHFHLYWNQLLSFFYCQNTKSLNVCIFAHFTVLCSFPAMPPCSCLPPAVANRTRLW